MKGHLQRRGKNSWRLKFDLDRDAAGIRSTRYVTVTGTKAQAQATRARRRCGHSASAGCVIGVRRTSAARRLGHGSPAITLKVYAHLIKSDDRVATVLQRLLTEPAK